MPAQQPNLLNWNTGQAEAQIEAHRKVVDYNIIEYPIEVIVKKYLGEEGDEEIKPTKPEFYIPDYQREHTWDQKRKSKFIESVLIGLPIPFLFLAEIDDEEGRLEIVDGSQRIRTLTEFVTGKLVLTELEKLPILDFIGYRRNSFFGKDLQKEALFGEIRFRTGIYAENWGL